MKKNRNWWWLLALIIILTLFVSSSMTYKQQTSVPLLERLLANKPGERFMTGINFTYASGDVISIARLGYFSFLEFFIRKLAHFSTFFILGFALVPALRTHVTPQWLRLFIVPLMCGGVAAFDEFHQMLTGGRSPMVQDVVLDMCGALTATLIVLLIEYLVAKRRKSLK